jgi:hypothetical protein
MKPIYVGIVLDMETTAVQVVSIARTKQRAGELAREWIDENSTPDRHKVFQIHTVSDRDYIELT